MESITLETRITKQEYRSLSYWNAFFKTPTLVILSVFSVLVGVANLLLNQQGLAFYLGLVLVLYPVLLIVAISIQVLRMNKSHDVEKASHARYIISEKGLNAHMLERNAQSFTKWEEIYRAYENRKFFILFINRAQLIAIKKADLPEGGEAFVRELLKRMLGKRCKIR